MKLAKITLIFIMLIVTTIFGLTAFAASGTNDLANLDAKVYSYSPVPVSAGEEFTLWIQLTNSSNLVAKNVEYQLDLEYPFTLSDFNSEFQNIPTISPYQTVTLKFNLKVDKGASDGTDQVKLRFRREGMDAYNLQSYDISISGSRPIIEITSSDILEASIGSDTTINLVLKNLGKKGAKDIFVTLDNSSDDMVKIVDLKTKYSETLEASSEMPISYKAVILKDATLKSYSLPITITYSSETTTYTISRSIGLQITDNPKITLNIQGIGTNNKLISGLENKINIEIYNTGNVDAEAVYIDTTSTEISDNIPSNFIGTIEKNNYDNTDLAFTVKNLKSGNYPLIINVHYKDGNQKEQVISKTLNVDVEGSNAQGSGLSIAIKTILIIIGIVIGLAILVLILRWAFKVIIMPAITAIGTIFKKRK